MFIDNNCELLSITLFGIEERHDHNEQPGDSLHDDVNVPEPALPHASYREILLYRNMDHFKATAMNERRKLLPEGHRHSG